MERALTPARHHAWVGIVSVVAACSTPAPPGQGTPAPAAAAPAVVRREAVPLEARRLAAPAVALPLERAFRLLAPGDGPRAELRYAVGEGEITSALVLRLSSRQLRAGAWSAWTALPPITTSLRLARTALDTVRCVPVAIAAATSPGAGPDAGPDAGVEPYVAAWAPLAGRTFSLRVDPRGQLGAVTVAAEGAPVVAAEPAIIDDLVQRWLAVRVPVPAEPVGVGASWRVTTVLRQRPAIVKQTATYRLIARTPARWTIAVEVDRIGETQEVVEPAIPAGVRVEVVALVRRLAGTVEIDPRRALPVAGDLTVNSTLHLRTYPRTGAAQEEIFEDSGTVQLVTIAGPR